MKQYINQVIDITLQDGFQYKQCTCTSIDVNLMMVKEHNDPDLTGVLLRDIKSIALSQSKRASSKKTPKQTSKKALAVKMKEEYPELSRKEAIEKMVTDIGMTYAGAATYYHLIWNN